MAENMGAFTNLVDGDRPIGVEVGVPSELDSVGSNFNASDSNSLYAGSTLQVPAAQVLMIIKV